MPAKARLITHNGLCQSLDAWARTTGIPASTIVSRLDRLGWDPARALTTPPDRRFRRGGRHKAGVGRPCPVVRRHHSGRAFVEWVMYGQRNTVYLGPWGSEEARAAYRRFQAEWAAGKYESRAPSGGLVFVGDVVVRWLAHCDRTYRKHGRITSEVHCNRAALAVVAELYGDRPADEFDPEALEAVRAVMVSGRGWSRKTVNDHVARIQRCWSWAVTKKLVRAATADALAHVAPLAGGRTEAAESRPRKPVPADHLEAVRPHLHPNPKRAAVVQAMIRFQLLTGMRPGELCGMRPEDLDRSGDVWRYAPADGGKTLHLDKPRCVWIGPRAQEVLAPALAQAEPGQPVFRFPPWRKKADWSRISVTRYRGIIARACRLAGVPVWTPHQLRHNRATDVQRIYESDREAALAIGDTPEVARQVYVDNPSEAVAKRIARETG